MSRRLPPVSEACGLPALEPSRVRILAEELGDSAPAHRFVATYLSMLPARFLRISDGVCQRDPDASMDAILSLKISSAMVGALETERHCRAMEAMVRCEQFADAASTLPALRRSTEDCLAVWPQTIG